MIAAMKNLKIAKESYTKVMKIMQTKGKYHISIWTRM
jgi:hypothetical protein